MFGLNLSKSSIFVVILASAASIVSFPAKAQQSNHYTYDVHGRLTYVQQGGAGSEHVTSYGLDAANNRNERAISPMYTQVWEAEALPHGAGFAEADGWAANIHTSNAHIIYGPYIPAPVGDRVAVFRMLIDVANGMDQTTMVVIDVNDATTMEVLASRAVTRADFYAGSVYQYFELPFTLAPERNGHALEYRVLFYPRAHIRVDKIGYR